MPYHLENSIIFIPWLSLGYRFAVALKIFRTHNP
jgi:hypothetical protein